MFLNVKYQCPLHENLDVNAMKKAAKILEGTHDFKSFCSNKKMKKSSVRTIYRIEVQEFSQEIILTFTGNGFLYNMVRILVGTLIEVGRGEREPETMEEILADVIEAWRALLLLPEDLTWKSDMKSKIDKEERNKSWKKPCRRRWNGK